MKYLIKVNVNQAIVVLMDKKHIHDASLLRGDLLELIERGITLVRIDLSETAYIDSAALGTLVTINKRLKEKNGSLVLTGAQGLLFERIKRTRLDKVFSIEVKEIKSLN